MLGVTVNQSSDTLDGPAPRVNSQYDSGVQVAVSMYGPNDFSTMTAQGQASCGGGADEHDSAGSPEGQWLGGPVQSSSNLQNSILENSVDNKHGVAPLYMAHGQSDCTVAYGQSQEMAAAYDKAGLIEELHGFPGKGHADSAILNGSVDGAIAFIEAHLPASATPVPTAAPTAEPTAVPTAGPTAAPTVAPTAAPTPAPTAAPGTTPRPTAVPVNTPAPTAVPTAAPNWRNAARCSGCAPLKNAARSQESVNNSPVFMPMTRK
jgi:hypothetical protein